MNFKRNRSHKRSCIKFFGYVKSKKVCALLFDELWEVIDLAAGKSLGTRESLNGQFGVVRLARSAWEANPPTKKDPRGCQECGHPFDLDSLGKYGCPDCHGEGLQKPDLLDCIHQGDSPREDLMWRSPNGTRLPVRKSRKGGDS